MSYSRRELYAMGEPLGESVTRKESGRTIYGGGGGGGSSAPEVAPPPPPPNRMASAAPPPAFTTYGQGDRTGSLVKSGNSYRPSTLDYSKPIYDPNYADNITGYQQSSQFYQPVYQPQYKNYNSSAQPATTGGNTLTFAIAKNLMNQAMTTGLPKSESDKYGGYAAVKAMYNAGGGSYDTPGQQYSAPSTPFNPYTNSYGGTGGAFPTQTPFSYQTASGQQANAPSTPFSYQTASGQQASAPSTASSTASSTPFSYQTASGQQSNTPLTASSTAPFTTPLTASSTPFSYQTASGQPNRDYGLSYSAPMQLPQYVYDTIRDIDSYQAQPVQAYKSPRATSSGPSQAIVGRSSQVRGTPNVMAKKAAGGITSLPKKYK